MGKEDVAASAGRKAGEAGEAKKGPKVGLSGKKICCSCPETKQARDECVVMNGEESCAGLIEAHKVCLRAEGFDV